MPLNGRNYTFLAQLGAGVTPIVPSRGMDATGGFVANGLPTPLNNYTGFVSGHGFSRTDARRKKWRL